MTVVFVCSKNKKARPPRRTRLHSQKWLCHESGFYGAGGGVPGDGDIAAEAGFVDHVASERCVVAEDGIFGERLARLDRREKCPEMRTNVVEVVAPENIIFKDRLFADLRIV